MVERSLQASQSGIALAKSALIGRRLTQTQLAQNLGVTRQPISKFFNGKAIDRDLFVRICEYLGLDWQAIALKSEAEPKESAEEIDRLVHEVREGIRSLVKERCGTMRVLDMTQPIQLTGEGGIYTNVNILEKITGRRRLEIAQLFENVDLDEFERFGLSAVKEKRIPGIEAVSKHRKLMVLGKPGAGKTTFLKYLAMNCIEENFLVDHVPIFITLKDFAETPGRPNLITYIASSFSRDDEITQIEDIVRRGRALILLDGLDEVREEDTTIVLRHIEIFSQRFPDNHFVITCRIAAKEYVFPRFTEVEVADFDDEQISTFVHNWFRCKDPNTAEASATRILEKLDENESIKELASSPLLLTLLCLECEESLEFPRNRADLYDRGLKVLLSKWDASRKIERHQIYEKLSLNRKEDLLSQLARKTFEQKDYFFKQRTVEQHISDYIINLPGADTDSQALLINSEEVLKAIEAQHGLLVERARGIYSFSHLTFQEYFTAKEIVNNTDYENVVKYVIEKQWREVFLLMANMMHKADRLLVLMKQSIDTLVQEDKKIQEFLKWVRDKSSSVTVPYNSAAVRAFYLMLTSPQNRKLPRALIESLDTDLYLDLEFNRDADFYRVLASDLDIDSGINYTLDFILVYIRIPKLSHNIISTLDSALEQSEIPELKCQLQELKDQLLNIYENNEEDFKRWWENNGNIWIQQFRTVIMKHRNIGQDWQFRQDQEDLLKQYCDANKLLVDCLNSDCYVSRDVRQEIEETLLVPMTEIKKRKAR